jgi:hypothetical protein
MVATCATAAVLAAAETTDTAVTAAASAWFCALGFGAAVSSSVVVLLSTVATEAVALGVGADVAALVSLAFGFLVLVDASGVTTSGITTSGVTISGTVTSGADSAGGSGGLALPAVPVFVWALTTTPSATVAEVVLAVEGSLPVAAGEVLASGFAGSSGADGFAVGSASLVAAPEGAELGALAELAEPVFAEPVEVSSAAAMP